MHAFNAAEKILMVEEGYREHPYHCSEGYPTIGHGQRIGPKGALLDQYQFQAPRRVAHEWMMWHINQLYGSTGELVLDLDTGAVRHAVLISMAYQMGVDGLGRFRRMLAALNDGDWELAAKEALDSKWAKQTPERARRHAEMLRTGELLPFYS